jgi:hypothetical protein
MKIGRSEFPAKVVDRIAKKAMHVCSNPHCLRLTGYGTTEGKARAIAEAAHINAASKNGPRPLPSGEDKDLRSEKNGIWLCLICHGKVDDDPSCYTEVVLKRWKLGHEDVIRNIVGKDLEAALLDLKNGKRYHQECRDLLSFFESKRVLYEGLDHEFPPRVRASLDLMRERIAMTRARVSPDSHLFTALNKLQQAINTFLRDIGKETDLETLRCDSSDPRWCRFSEELIKLRSGMIIIMKILAGDAGYALTWV